MRFNRKAFDAVKDNETSSFQDEITNTDQAKTLGYTAGCYSDSRVKACSNEPTSEYRNCSWTNEWEYIPQDDKNTLIKWLNENVNFDKDLYDHSIRIYETHPTMEILLKEGVIETPEPRKKLVELKIFKDDTNPTCKNQALLEYAHDNAKEFMNAFLKHINKKSDMMPVFNWAKLRLGFLIENEHEVHFIRLTTLNPIWSPKTQPKLLNEAKTKMLKKSAKNDIYLNKIFRTTHKNDMGMDWVGILTLNIAPMSTLPNGTQNALQLPRPRYKIEWINIKTREAITEYYESVLISTMIEDNLIHETPGYEKANIYPREAQIDYDETRVLTGKERDQYWVKKKGNPNIHQ